MPGYSSELVFFGIGLLLVLTVLAGSLSSRFGLPALIGFMLLGMLAGSEGLGGISFESVGLAQGIGVLSLVFILFSGGLDTIWREVRGGAAPALVLATAGVMISAAVVAVAAMWLLGFTPLQGFLLGSVIASTDAAAVFALMRSRNMPLHDDVKGVIEVESGSNDPMAIFLVGAVLLLIAVPETSPLALVPAFGVQMAVGAVVGYAIGIGFPALLRRARLRVGGLALVVSIAAALLSYGLAGLLQGNGFLAAYMAGIVAGAREFPSRRTISMFQDGLAWLAQVLMFLTLGLLVFPSELVEVLGPGLAITAVLMFVARPLSVFLCLAPFRRYGWRSKLFVSWAGLRGAVPIVLATFPIVAGVPGAQSIFNIVFFVVLLSSVIQGPTLGWLARRLGLDTPRPPGSPAR
ncbi:potassium/proton antiporter [Luteimonas sp. RD2P54]|uniref:Potassium/proton antiporter n=1 Tax=Luteimonas endophytica TaxID=3042023 RepID=A0ABT6JFS0_9GAMM|nr:potassium/proton antiporter [Luteimonas endophytica]MDH5825038.1 potassium/proton antiporter [Luteimonas endophytica]